jgi:hypothetical protein
MVAAAWTVPREAMVELRREHEPSRAQMKTALEASWEVLAASSDSDGMDIKGEGPQERWDRACALVRVALGKS